MGYQVLARKWRPKKFNELMGQDHVVNVLMNALSQQRLHHAYLFTGTRGVGKTTIARIFAKSLNCLTGISTEPCGICDACVDIDQGRFVDLLEIDAASRTKVDDTREILDNVQYAPSRGRYKVYLIDEVHMLSRSSFNALLKTLEEPPEHVKFILATTDPQKLPITVLSRCLQFHLKALNVHQIKQQLDSILAEESVSIDSGSLSLIAKSARGSMRDALSLTDQAIAQGQGKITLANVQQMLGGIDQHWAYKILIALVKHDTQGLMNLSLEIASYSPSYSRLLAEIIQLLHQVAISQVVDYSFDLSPEHSELLTKFTHTMSPEDVQLYYQIAVEGRKDLPYALDEQAAFDMTLLRLAAFQPQPHEIKSAKELSCVKENTNDMGFDDVILTDVSMTVESSTKAILPDLSTSESAKVELMVNQSLQPLQPLQPIEQSVKKDVNSLPASNLSVKESTDYENVDEEKYSVRSEDNLQSSIAPVDKLNLDNTIASSPIAAVLASRNMLRSKKKQLEKQVKKSDDALTRQINSATSEEIKSNQTEFLGEHTESDPAQGITEATDMLMLQSSEYSPEVIDPATIHSANQVDKWANMIDHMALNGRLRQLAIHATINQSSNDNHLILNLNKSTKHLQSDAAHSQLEQALSNWLKRNIIVTIDIVDDTVADPYKIQSDINDKRYQYAKNLLKEDDVVQHFQNEFQATIDESTIVAR